RLEHVVGGVEAAGLLGLGGLLRLGGVARGGRLAGLRGLLGGGLLRAGLGLLAHRWVSCGLGVSRAAGLSASGGDGSGGSIREALQLAEVVVDHAVGAAAPVGAALDVAGHLEEFLLGDVALDIPAHPAPLAFGVADE